jgi:cell division protein FtsA
MTVLQFSRMPKAKPVSPKRSALVAALDVGTSKIACVIARLKPRAPQEVLRQRSHTIEVIGYGHTSARGIKGGAVVDLQGAEEALRQAIDTAERAAKLQLESVIVSISAGRPASELMSASVAVGGASVTNHDIARVMAAGSQHSARPGRAILHSLPIGYRLDGVSGIRDPRGMLGQDFGVDMHVMSADMSVIRNLFYAIENCHINVASMVASPYAAALAVLADDEGDLGAALIDMGAGTTTIAVFSGGRFVHGDGFALGGHHVTMDIARGFSTGIADAERIKALHGSVLAGGSDERDMIEVQPLDEYDMPHFVSRAQLVQIIRPRVEEILEMIRDRLAASPFAADPRGRVVLTGGACQLTGLAELASQILGRPIRIGRPLGISGLPDEAKGPAFAATAGLLVYPQVAHLEPSGEARRARRAMTGTDGYFARVGRWLRESF